MRHEKILRPIYEAGREGHGRGFGHCYCRDKVRCCFCDSPRDAIWKRSNGTSIPVAEMSSSYRRNAARYWEDALRRHRKLTAWLKENREAYLEMRNG